MKKILKRRLLHIVLILTIALIGCDSTQAQNVAKGRKYTMSEKPNYSGTEGNDETDLTDGTKKTGQRFWQDKSTTGWSNKKEIHIDLDLETVHSIDGFLINTARNSGAEVEFPLSCLVFTSVDNKEFEYRGDLMLSGENNSGGYQVKDFRLTQGNSPGRFVKFVISTKSKFVFLDEIEVYGKQTNETMATLRSKIGGNLVHKSNLEAFIKEALTESAEIRGEYMRIQSARDFIGGEDENELGDLKIEGKSMGDLQKMRKEISNARIKAQSRALAEGVVFTPIDGIDALKSFSLNDVVKAQGGSNQAAGVRDDAFRYFSLVNNSDAKQLVSFQAPNQTPYEIYEIVSVASLNSGNIRDALRAVSDNTVSMEAGDNRFFVLSDTKEGVEGDLQIVGEGGQKILGTLPIGGVKQISDDPQGKLHVNVWAYLDKPILKDNKEFVISDLEKSGVDVLVVHSDFIDGYDTNDFARLKRYLNQFENLDKKKVLLFYNLKSNAAKRFNGQKFLDQSWKSNFAKWYKLMQKELSQIGVNVEELYFYPYDEIKVNEVENFVNLVKWGKTEIPNFKTFVTIIDEKTYEASNYADLVQLSLFDVKNLDQIKNDEIWMYSVLDRSRERSPYKDYRLMSWVAYYNDLKGVGFWNYSALQSGEDARFDAVINGNRDYSVLYLDENNQVLTSLRWLYFKQGIRDYALLKNGEKRVGKQKMKELVKKVIDNGNDTKQADLVLKQILKN